MAKDVSGKSLSSHNSASNSPPSNADQQKVPPLRIVLNPAGNQKASSTAVSLSSDSQQQQQDAKRERQDVKPDNVVTTKPSGKVRIKLTSAKQAIKNQTSNDTSVRNSQSDSHRLKVSNADKSDHLNKEDPNPHIYSHLRRITRRSHRSVQFISNEDEESISSMTSTDENQTTTTNNNDSDINSSAHDTPAQQTNSQTDLASSNSTTTTNSSTTANSNNTDTPRRYKRRKGEATECTLNEIDLAFGYQNYKLPNQNSFELFRNIRKQVDKKLRGLSSINARVPYGFRDYMLNRGSYLLDGNKLGNGTILSVNEDGDLYQPPMARWRAFKLPRVSYSVPNRAKVPPSLPLNSPLHHLFVEQERDRYRMRMQHIKEREKLTLAAEQEIIRVYNQAAMAAANQEEPFSVCTMLKHQEVYNYLDADGVMIQAQEDIQPDPMKQNGVRTRRRQHEHISPPPTRKVSNADDMTQNSKDKEVASSEPSAGSEESQKSSECSRSKSSPKNETGSSESDSSPASKKVKPEKKDEEEISQEGVELVDKAKGSPCSDAKEIEEPGSRGVIDAKSATAKPKCEDEKAAQLLDGKPSESANSETIKQDTSDESVLEKTNDASPNCNQTSSDEQDAGQASISKEPKKVTKSRDNQQVFDKGSEMSVNQVDAKNASEEQASSYANSQGSSDQDKSRVDGNNLSEDDKPALITDAFLLQLQDIDDKWEKIRLEMLIRHKNEAESLNAVQKLEWEWKAKEIGVCDVRTSLIIDNSFVPKLNIFSQDY